MNPHFRESGHCVVLTYSFDALIVDYYESYEFLEYFKTKHEAHLSKIFS